MSKFKNAAVCLFAFTAQYLFAQSSYFNIVESRKFPDQNYQTQVESVHTLDNGETAVARSSKRKLIFEIYNDEAKSIYNSFAELNKKESVLADLFYDNKLKIFTVEKPSKTERIINCHVLNTQSKNYQKIEVYRTTVEKRSSLFNFEGKRQTHLTISPDGNLLALAINRKRKKTNSAEIQVFDGETLEPLFAKSYFSKEDKYYRQSDMVVDNFGNVFIIGKESFKGKRDKKNGKVNYSYIVNMVNKDEVKSETIVLDEKEFIQDLRIVLRETEIDLVGFYSDKNQNTIKGINQFKLDAESLTVKNSKQLLLPEKVYKDLFGDYIAEAKEKGLSSFYLDHVLEDEAGNIYLLAEEFFITYNYVSTGFGVNGGGGYTTTTYHYNDLLIVKLNQDGSLGWGRSIFKRSGAPSYNVFIHDDKLHVFLNSGKHLKEKKDGRVKVSQGWFESSSLYNFVYDVEGNLSREKIQDNKSKTTYTPYYGSFNNGMFVMFNESKINRQLMMLIGK